MWGRGGNEGGQLGNYKWGHTDTIHTSIFGVYRDSNVAMAASEPDPAKGGSREGGGEAVSEQPL